MPFASGSHHGLRYIRESGFGATPENPAMRALRHTSCSLILSKDSFQSNELRPDAQIQDLRHGVKQSGGDVGIEFSYGEFDDFLAAAVRGQWKNDVLIAGVEDQFFTIERIFADIGKFQTFTGMAVNTLSLDIQPNAMITGSINFVGKNVDFSSKELAASEAPSYTYAPLDGFQGALKENGAPIAVVTSISLNINNAIEPAFVIGSSEAAALVFGRINVTGTISAYFENLDLLRKFEMETESEIEITLGNGGPGSYVVTLPRIKYSGGSNPVDGEGPITLDMPFQALFDECSGTNIRIVRIPAEEDKPVPCVLRYAPLEFEENEDGGFAPIIATLEGKTFSGFNDQALPGVQIGEISPGLSAKVTRVSDTEAKIVLSGEPATRETDGTLALTFPASSFTKGFCHCEGYGVQNATRTFAVKYAAPAAETPGGGEESKDENRNDDNQENGQGDE